MPKPLEGVQGSGMHTHLSPFRGDNAFHDPDDLQPVAARQSPMAGLVAHAAEITAITNPTVNSYKRLVPGFEAPVHVSWARNNRSGLIRVPIPKRETRRQRASSTGHQTRPAIRISPSASCWPPVCAASLRPPRVNGRATRISSNWTMPSPRSSGLAPVAAVAAPAAGDGEARASLRSVGEHIFEWFRNKRSRVARLQDARQPVRTGSIFGGRWGKSQGCEHARSESGC